MALVLRADRKMFYGVISGTGETATTTYTRMKGFTALSESKNASEYSRKYVDEYFEATDVTGMSSSYAFTFDMMTPNDVLDDMAAIIDDEKLGEDAIREFISVDFNKPVESGGFEAVRRKYAIIGDTIGDGTDALTYSGTLKVQSTIEKGTATISTPSTGGTSENVEEITFVANE